MGMRRAFCFACLTLFACSSGSKGGGTPNGSTGGTAGTGGTGGAQGGTGGTQVGPGGAGGAAQGGSSGTGAATLTLPRVYPPVRAATPTALIANPSYAAQPFQRAAGAGFGTARQALTSGINLATAIQERFYSTGPTDLLRIVNGVDGRVQGLDLTVAAHPCLSTPPIEHTYVLPGGQTFTVKLQCLQRFGTPGMNAGWVGFGIERSASADAGASGESGLGVAADASPPDDSGTPARDAGLATDSGSDFYLIEGQEGGNGGAYHIAGNGNVEGWVAVAERDIPANSQVIMHLLTDQATGTLELALAGSAVGFCAAHLKTNPEMLFVTGKTNAPPPPGTMQAVGTQYCDTPRSGCYRADDLDTDLGSDSPSCAPVGPSSFGIGEELDSDTSADAGVNVVTTDIYSYFNQVPVGVPDF
jgi:hypothetical protein